ncbi:MAG: hypothetical protein ABJN36_11510, partial [Cyclobacteriaceae bacterium]
FKYKQAVLAVKLFNIVILALVTCVPILLLYTVLGEQLSRHYITFWLFAILVLIGLNRALAAMHLAIDQMERQPVPYFVFYLLMAITLVGVMAMLIAGDNFTWQSLLFIEAGVLLLLNLVYLSRLNGRGYLVARLDRAASLEFSKFSFPLLGHVGALWAISFLDRLVIAELVGIEAVGAYSVAHTAALGLSLIHESAHRAWQPIFYKKMQNEDPTEQRKIVRYTWGYYGVTVISAILYMLLTLFFLQFFLPPEYDEVFTLLPFLVTGFAILGMYRFAAGYFYHYRDTKVLSFITVGCGLFHLVIMIFFVLFFGAIGAAYALILSYSLLFVLTMMVASKFYNISWLSIRI